MSPRSSLTVSPDGAWVAVRRGERLSLLARGTGPAVARTDLGADDVDVAFVAGAPAPMLAVVVRNVAPRVMLYHVPTLEVAGRHDLAAPLRIVAVTQARVVLGTAEAKKLGFVRAGAGVLGVQFVDLDAPLDVAVGLANDQLVVGTPRKLEIWDALAARPTLRISLQLPPPPRTLGAAAGHVWIARPTADDLHVHRLSDGKTFRHVLGAPPLDVVGHPASPVVVAGTAHGLVRVHCVAHAVTALDAPWSAGTPLAQLVSDGDVSVLGLADGQTEPWRVAVDGAGAPAVPPPPAEEPAAPAPVKPAPPPAKPSARPWRAQIAAIGAELVAGRTPELVAALEDSELADLADRLLLSQRSIRALIALYGRYLVGEPALSIADLAHVLGDWTEPLGTGELGALAMLDRARGRVSLRPEVTDLLDGARPRAVRLVGASHTSTKPASKPVTKLLVAGAWRYAREGKSDSDLEALLAATFGRIAVIEGDPDRAILEARLRGATAIAFHPPAHKPTPWPRDANLVLVLYGSASSWIADLPNLEV